MMDNSYYFPNSVYSGRYVPVYRNELKDIYDKVEVGDTILVKGIRKNSKWVEVKVLAKKISKVYHSGVCNIATSEGILRDYYDFKWRYRELYPENRYLLHGFWNRRKEIKLL